ncbi:2,3-dihydro-2,3-dihydroxybenzoate dehydrogenase [Pseudaeromonas sp. ZJS20]|uniref:2,3-dihydro-2,3-dihydroxybenzoate dehydrogenase n=1 Tax=Pseudaeromonas aegiceratis TaxID=3153928 RepID=UPI00390C6D7C
MNRWQWRGERVLVTGGAQGIGEAVVTALLAEGRQVMVWDRDKRALDGLSERHAGAGLQVAEVDMAQWQELAPRVAELEACWGPIDYLVNVAGVLAMASALSLTPEQWLHSFAVNTHGPFFLSQAVGGRMAARGGGAIVTVGSNAGRTPRVQMAAYGASKAATLSWMRTLGLELAGQGVRCNLVSPGSTDTRMQRQLWQDESGPARVIEGSLADYRLGIPLGRLCQPAQVADAVLFLLSEQAAQITLHDLRVDGGATLDQ